MEFGTVAPTFPPIGEARITAKRLEEKGYASIWFPDHLMGWYPHDVWKETPFAMRYPSCHMFFDPFCEICYVAPYAERIRFGVGVTEVFRRNPAVLLQQAVTANHATNGRFILGIGAGEAENTVPYGIEFRHQVARLEEALQLIRIMLESDYGEKINFKGRFYRFEDALFDLKPVGEIPVWIGAHGERMLMLTARYADGWLPVSTTVEEYAERVEKLERYAKTEGRDPDEITKALFASVVVDESEEEVERLLQAPILRIHALLLHHRVYEKYGYRHPFGKYYGLLEYIPTRFSKEEILEAVSGIPDEIVRLAFVCGTPEQVVETFDAYAKLGVEHIVVWNLTYFGDASKVRSSYELVDEIIDHFERKS